KAFFSQANVWDEPQDKVFSYKGHPGGARHVAATLLKSDIDLAYAYRMRYPLGLPHAFINTLLYLDYDRRGFPYPIVPFHVNCYGSAVIAGHGGATQLDGGQALADPPSPSPKRCFDIGAAVARALAESPWRVALIGSSSWSHAFLSDRNHYLWPDRDADRARFAELESGAHGRWRDLPLAEIEHAGQHEFLNW